MAFPGLQHVAITVSDLDASTQWYTRLFGADPVLDEDEEGGEFHHVVYALDGGLLFGLHTHMGREAKDRADERRTGPRPHQLRPVGHLPSSRSGATASTSWGSSTAGSRRRTTARASRSATPTTSPSSSSSRPAPDPTRA